MDDQQPEKRCFLGLTLPVTAARKLAQEAASIREKASRTRFRWIATDNFHLTLAFLGDLYPQEIARLETLLAAQRWLSSPLALEIRVLGGFPSAARSRYVVAHIEPNETLASVYQDLQKLLRETDYRSEARSLRPHITLARGTRQRSTSAVAQHCLATPIRFDASELVLFESVSGPAGSVYTELARFA